MYHAWVQEQKDNGMSRDLFGILVKLAQHLQLDCGIHPGLSGMDALPYTDMIDADEINLLLISQ